MKVLLLGGTGAIGNALIKELEKLIDTEIYITSRKNRSGASTDRRHYIQCDAKNNDNLKHLLGSNTYDVIVDFLVYETEEFRLRCELLCSNCDHYIFLSSCRALAGTDGKLNEESPRLIDISQDQEFLATDEYSLIKGREENLLKDCDYQNWTIIRPYITYNVNRLQLGVFEKEWWLYRAIHGRKILFSREIGERYTTLTHGDDVARVISVIIFKQMFKGEIVHPVTSKAIKWENVLEIYCDALKDVTGKKQEIVWIDSMEKKIPGITRYNRYQIKYDRAIDRIFDNQKALSVMPEGFQFIDPEEGLRHCLIEFMRKPDFGEILWKMQAYMDIVCRDRTPGREIADTSMRAKYLIWRYTPYLSIVEKGIR